LTEFAAQTGLQIVYLSDVAATLMSNGAPRGLPARDALERLLQGTGLQFEYLNERTVRIFAPLDQPGRTSSGAAAVARSTQTRATSRLVALEEVVVTARRRQEPLRDVPISAAVWTQEAMEASGVKGIDEIGALTPGVEFDFVSKFGDFFTNLVIRGVTDMHGTATSVFLDDTPLPPGRGETFLRAYPIAFDLDRVEVLRGPQGGLLGQDALGGAVRFVVNEPSLTTYGGLARTELAWTERGDPSYEAGAALGGPVTPDVLGFRLSGWYRSDGGYIDQVSLLTGSTVDDDANHTISRSMRGALTWAPDESFRLTPSLAWQSIRYRNSSAFFEHLSDPENGKLASVDNVKTEDQLYVAALRLTAQFRRADLSAVVSYVQNDLAATGDASLVQPDPAPTSFGVEQDVFSYEARLASSDPAAALGWVAGLWYSTGRIREDFLTEDEQDDVDRSTVTDQTDLAGFGQVSYRFTKRLTALAGVRVGRSHYDAVTELPPTARTEGSDSSVTPRFGLTYQSDKFGMVYATAAKGFRPGGVYAPVWGCGYGPAPYAADSLWSYEIGSKASLLDGRLDLDTSVFHITWGNDEPPYGADCVPNLYRPVSAAASNGFTIAARAYPTDRVRVGLALAYIDAHYTETVRSEDGVIIEDGDALGTPPRVPWPWSVTASVENDFAVARDATLTIRAEDIFHSENHGPFYTRHPASAYYATIQRVSPSTNVLNLRATLTWSSLDTALFVNNVLDSQPTLMPDGGGPEDPYSEATTLRPRTIGLSATWRF
jgi:outer membrane receptor protein involved in Fe transport